MSSHFYAMLAGLSMHEGKAVLRAMRWDASDREVLFYRQKGKCFYCGCQMTKKRRKPGAVDPRSLTVDHVMTRRMGGRDGPKVGACYDCNTRRGDLPAHDFLMAVAREQGWINLDTLSDAELLGHANSLLAQARVDQAGARDLGKAEQ